MSAELPPDSARHAADVVEFLAKLAGGLLIVWGFMARVAKPFGDWRRRRLQEAIRGALRDDLDALRPLPGQVALAIERQSRVFDEMDLFMIVASDSRDRLDELNDFLDEVGFASRDRRLSSERRRLADDAFAELQGRLKGRRRQDDDMRPTRGD